jgi:ABC-type transport system involved in multi-copper enzyme maturation permease subunit
MMRAATRAALVIAEAELRSALAGRLVQGLGVLFALLAAGIAVAGLAASGQLLVQGFTRTAVSLLTLALYFLPLIGLVLGAHAFGAEDGGAELLLAQPVGRGTVLLGRCLGLAATLVLVAAIGFGLAGVMVGLGAGATGIAGYLLVAAGSSVVGFAGLAIGVLLGVRARRRVTAVAMALVTWAALAVLFDFAAIALLQFTGDGEPGPLLVLLLAANPIDGMRALALVGLGADVLLGPTGAALSRLLGPSGGALLVGAALLAWCASPLAWASRVYQRRDF